MQKNRKGRIRFIFLLCKKIGFQQIYMSLRLLYISSFFFFSRSKKRSPLFFSFFSHSLFLPPLFCLLFFVPSFFATSFFATSFCRRQKEKQAKKRNRQKRETGKKVYAFYFFYNCRQNQKLSNALQIFAAQDI